MLVLLILWRKTTGIVHNGMATWKSIRFPAQAAGEKVLSENVSELQWKDKKLLLEVKHTTLPMSL